MASKPTKSSKRRQIAFLIANDNYTRSENRLNQCIPNASHLRDVLKSIHFRVEFCKDVENEMMKSIKGFTEKIRDGDLVLFYFSGHGYQINGKNYLIPVKDSQIESNIDVEDSGTDVQRIIERIMDNRSSCVLIMILDCCRPYMLKKRSTAQGKYR